MRISIQHQTHYRFDQPVWHGVQRLRLTPRDCAMQKVLGWQLSVEGGAIECSYEDHNRNLVSLISLGTGNGEITITGQGMIETYDKAGVVGAHTGFMPLWRLSNPTELTKPGPKIRALAAKFSDDGSNTIAVLHDLMAAVNKAVVYEAGHTGAATTAEAALAAGKGVCQDHAQVFMATARLMGLPARYVSGYLVIEGRVDQDAGHGWAEVHVPGLGWVGFDAANDTCPDDTYVRLAVGADYRDAAPVTSMAQGGGAAVLSVAVQVAQQQVVEQ